MPLRIGRFSIEKFGLDNLYSIYLGMNPKEQTVSMIAAGIVVLLVIILPVTVASNRISKLEDEATKGRDHIREVMKEIESFDAKSNKLKQMQAMIGGGFDSSISSTLETLAENNGIKDKIDSLKEKPTQPTETFDEASVDMRLKKVKLDQLVQYLHSIENNTNTILRLKSLSVKPRFDNKQDLDASFNVSTYRLLEGAAEAPEAGAEEGK
jgi:general secretion pathway protein M